ncbi:MAG TPA: MaoC family dehydratase [Candidatus Binatia bacterium]|nr:MaoC family dehydratase [Candidatus Binatia bacterium]
MGEHEHKGFDDLRVGDRAVCEKTIGADDVARFAELTGDRHPAHLDEEYARATRFGRPVVHGMLTASLLSTANARLLGVPGAISVEQTLRFLRPVFVGDTITAASEIVEIYPATRRLRCRTRCTNQRGEVVIDGQAIEQKDEG